MHHRYVAFWPLVAMPTAITILILGCKLRGSKHMDGGMIIFGWAMLSDGEIGMGKGRILKDPNLFPPFIFSLETNEGNPFQIRKIWIYPSSLKLQCPKPRAPFLLLRLWWLSCSGNWKRALTLCLFFNLQAENCPNSLCCGKNENREPSWDFYRKSWPTFRICALIEFEIWNPLSDSRVTGQNNNLSSFFSGFFYSAKDHAGSRSVCRGM